MRRGSILAACVLIAAWGRGPASAQDIPSPADAFTTLVADESDSEPVGTRTPLILVHGLHGNAIASVDDIANLNTAYFEQLIALLGPALGTFTFTSSVPISVVALRGFTNKRGDFLITTLPVAPLSSTATDTIYFPHFADGDGWTTQVVLVNPTDSTISGNIEFLGQGSGTTPAARVTLTMDDSAIGSSFAYSIPPRSSQRFTTSNPAGSVSVGSVRATSDVGSISPSGLGIFSFITGGFTVSGAGVPALREASAFRVYVEASGTPGAMDSVRSGLAITDTSGTTNTVTIELTDLDGVTVGAAETLSIPPSGQVAQFLDEIFTLPANFSGVLRVTSTADVAILGLRARTNQRGDFMITTTPPSNELTAPTSVDVYFPHIADSGGWSTQFVLFSGNAGQSSSGVLSFIDQTGQPLDLELGPKQAHSEWTTGRMAAVKLEA